MVDWSNITPAQRGWLDAAPPGYERIVMHEPEFPFREIRREILRNASATVDREHGS